LVNFNLKLTLIHPGAGSEVVAGMGSDFSRCGESIGKVILQYVVTESPVKDVASA